MATSLNGVALPDPQFLSQVRMTLAEFYVGFDGSMLVDTTDGLTTYVYDVKVRWEALTEAEKNTIKGAWNSLVTTPAGVAYVGPDGVSGTAHTKVNDRRFPKEGRVTHTGDLDWNIYLTFLVTSNA